MNLSCVNKVSYFDSPDFLSLMFHITIGISSPIHLFGLYCILFKTPEQMKTVKWYLVNLHTWIVLFDYSFGLLTVPYVLLPSFSGYPLGILRFIGVPTVDQTLLVLVIFACVSSSMVAIFENRFHTICKHSGKPSWSFWRRPWLGAHYIVAIIILAPFRFLVPEQLIARMHVLESLPCLPDYIKSTPIFVLAENYTYHMVSCVTYVIITCCEIFLFVYFLVWNVIKQLQAKTISRRTFQLQRKFCLALVTQIGTPLFMLILPLTYAFMAIKLEYYNQTITNIAVITGSMHGFVSTLVMLFVHHPYRETLFDICRRQNRKLDVTSKRGSRYLRNNSVGPIRN